MLLIRPAAPSDVPLLLTCFRELAEYQRQPHAVVVKEETLTRDDFAVEPKFRGLIAEWDRQVIGYALFFGFYSSWKGPGIFLEDLFVRETFRDRGIEERCGVRMSVLRGGKAAMAFAGEVLVGMSRQFNSKNHWGASFSMIGDKCSCKRTR